MLEIPVNLRYFGTLNLANPVFAYSRTSSTEMLLELLASSVSLTYAATSSPKKVIHSWWVIGKGHVKIIPSYQRVNKIYWQTSEPSSWNDHWSNKLSQSNQMEFYNILFHCNSKSGWNFGDGDNVSPKLMSPLTLHFELT